MYCIWKTAAYVKADVQPFFQIGGIRFLYDNLVESLERYNTNNGFGCILAHSMGLGKTLQVISFIDIFLRYTKGERVMVIVPVNTLQNWVHEFNMWLPVPDSEKDDDPNCNPKPMAPKPKEPKKASKKKKSKKEKVKKEKEELGKGISADEKTLADNQGTGGNNIEFKPSLLMDNKTEDHMLKQDPSIMNLQTQPGCPPMGMGANPMGQTQPWFGNNQVPNSQPFSGGMDNRSNSQSDLVQGVQGMHMSSDNCGNGPNPMPNPGHWGNQFPNSGYGNMNPDMNPGQGPNNFGGQFDMGPGGPNPPNFMPSNSLPNSGNYPMHTNMGNSGSMNPGMYPGSGVPPGGNWGNPAGQGMGGNMNSNYNNTWGQGYGYGDMPSNHGNDRFPPSSNYPPFPPPPNQVRPQQPPVGVIAPQKPMENESNQGYRQQGSGSTPSTSFPVQDGDKVKDSEMASDHKSAMMGSCDSDRKKTEMGCEDQGKLSNPSGSMPNQDSYGSHMQNMGNSSGSASDTSGNPSMAAPHGMANPSSPAPHGLGNHSGSLPQGMGIPPCPMPQGMTNLSGPVPQGMGNPSGSVQQGMVNHSGFQSPQMAPHFQNPCGPQGQPMANSGYQPQQGNPYDALPQDNMGSVSGYQSQPMSGTSFGAQPYDLGNPSLPPNQNFQGMSGSQAQGPGSDMPGTGFSGCQSQGTFGMQNQAGSHSQMTSSESHQMDAKDSFAPPSLDSSGVKHDPDSSATKTMQNVDAESSLENKQSSGNPGVKPNANTATEDPNNKDSCQSKGDSDTIMEVSKSPPSNKNSGNTETEMDVSIVGGPQCTNPGSPRNAAEEKLSSAENNDQASKTNSQTVEGTPEEEPKKQPEGNLSAFEEFMHTVDELNKEEQEAKSQEEEEKQKEKLEIQYRTFKLFVLNDNLKTMVSRAKVVSEYLCLCTPRSQYF